MSRVELDFMPTGLGVILLIRKVRGKLMPLREHSPEELGLLGSMLHKVLTQKEMDDLQAAIDLETEATA